MTRVWRRQRPSPPRWLLVVCTGLVSAPACDKGEAPAAPGPAAASSSGAGGSPGAAVDLEGLWRESVQYRSAHQAMAANVQSLADDVGRSARMLGTVEAFERVPVVADTAADAATAREALLAYAKRLGIRADVKVTTPPAPPAPGPEIDAAQGLRYESPQVLGAHEVELTFGDGLTNGPKLVGDLNALGRVFEPTGAKIGRDGEGVLRGRVAFFRDLPPVRFVRKAPPFVAKLAAFPQPTPAERGRLDEIRANVAQVDALAAPLEQAFAHQATLKVSTARFRAYGELIERYNRESWTSALARGLP